ncbi:MAG TPA: hypothetical protein VFN69_04555 [Rudaea sp.]|nr:hypothetical protein [Rudaea sp.]
MGDNTEDVRTKISAEEHEFLSAVALGTGEEIASITRRLIREFLAAKRHEYTIAARFSEAKGIAGMPAGTVRRQRP